MCGAIVNAKTQAVMISVVVTAADGAVDGVTAMMPQSIRSMSTASTPAYLIVLLARDDTHDSLLSILCPTL